MKLRKSFAVAAIAGAVVLGAAACSSDSDSVSDVTSQVSEAVTDGASEASEAVSDAADDAEDAVTGGLSDSNAQEILRKAVDPATSADELDAVVDTSNPTTKTALSAYATASNAAGYTPDVYTVTAVTEDGDDKATATVALKSPHAPAPVEFPLSFVKVDGDWKLSGDAVEQLAQLGGGR